MPSNITADDMFGAPSAPQKAGPRPITADELISINQAQSKNTVQERRLANAQGIRDLGYVDPRSGGNPDVPIDGFMRHEAPPVQNASSANFGASVKAGLVEDPDTKRRMIAGSLFPNDPNGVNRVGFMDGTPVFVNDSGQLEKVSPWYVRFGAGVVANAPEAIGGAIGSFATMPAAAVGAPVWGGTLGAVGGKALKRGFAGLVLGEPLTMGGVSMDLAQEGALNVATGGLAKGVTSFIDRGKFIQGRDFTPNNQVAANAARDATESATGIRLDLAQASGNPKLGALRAYAARFPGRSSELLRANEELQAGQLDSAVTRVLDNIGNSSPAEVAGAGGKNAAQFVIDAAKASRDQAVRPYYEAAGKIQISNDVLETFNKDPVLRSISSKVRNNPLYQRDLGINPDAITVIPGQTGYATGTVKDRLLNMEKQGPVGRPRSTPEQVVPGDAGDNTVAFWHQVQQELDDQISKNAAEPNKARILVQARKDLNAKLEAASPEFAQANAFYSKTTRSTVEPLEKGVVGVLSRISDPKAATAGARIFSDPSITASQLRATRATIVATQGGEEAWNGLVRQWVGQNWNKALKETQAGAELNAAGKLRQALFGTPNDRAKMQAMLPPNAIQAFEDLMTAAQALARTPSSGSNTYRDTVIGEGLSASGASTLKWLTSLRAQAVKGWEGKALEENTLAVTEALLDPAKQRLLRKVVKMSDQAQQVSALTAILGGQIGARSLSAPGDDLAPVAPRKPQQR